MVGLEGILHLCIDVQRVLHHLRVLLRPVLDRAGTARRHASCQRVERPGRD